MLKLATLLKAMHGDKAAFVTLMEDEKKKLYKITCCYLSNEEDRADAMQETILACYEKIGTLKNPKFFRTWLVRILINKCEDILRYNKKVQPEDKLCENEMSYDKNLVEFWDLLNRIDSKYQTVLILYYVEGLSIKEISEVTGLNKSTVGTRLRRGREAYKELLG